LVFGAKSFALSLLSLKKKVSSEIKEITFVSKAKLFGEGITMNEQMRE
jgi:hypothetical protein